MILSFSGATGVSGSQLAAALAELAGCERLLADLSPRLELARLAGEEQVSSSELESLVDGAYLGHAGPVAQSMLRWWRNPCFARTQAAVTAERLLGAEAAAVLGDVCAIACAWAECGRPALYVQGPLLVAADDLPRLKGWLPPLPTRSALTAATDTPGALAVNCFWRPEEPAPWRFAREATASGVAFSLYE